MGFSKADLRHTAMCNGESTVMDRNARHNPSLLAIGQLSHRYMELSRSLWDHLRTDGAGASLQRAQERRSQCFNCSGGTAVAASTSMKHLYFVNPQGCATSDKLITDSLFVRSPILHTISNDTYSRLASHSFPFRFFFESSLQWHQWRPLVRPS